MNKFKTLSYLLLSISIAGCNGLGKMAKNYPTVKHEVTPNPLELRGDSVAVSIKGTYPPKYFAKSVDVNVTPVLKSSTNEHKFKTVTMVGEKSKSTGNKINQKAGGSFTYADKIAFTPDMKAADLMINSVGLKGTTTKELGSVKVADGTIVTQLLVQPDEKTIGGKDAFQRITPSNFNGTIYYLINTSNVNPNFKVKDCNINNKDEFAKLDSAIRTLTIAPYNLKNVNIMGYASPDGKESLNANLAQNRSKTSAKYLASQMSSYMSKQTKTKVNIKPDSSLFALNVTNEDWGGFQQLMQESSMPQKDMVLRIVSSNSDPEAREMEIKKMGKAYTEIAQSVLPKLRRSAIVFNADKTGRSDEQISALAKSNPDSLSVEELLYAGNMATDRNDKLAIYQSAERIYPQDWRTSNNVGMVMFQNGDFNGAMSEFTKADQLSSGNAIVKNNLGAAYSRQGDRKNAYTNYASASSAGPEVNENLGIIDIRNGDYAAAVSHYGNVNSFNAALAKLLNGDKDGAMATIQASPDNDSANGLYLKAIISMRKGDSAGAIDNLKRSIAANPSMKSMAAEDREFVKLFNDASFKAAVQ
jgi:tetratricopeptide (TPR) repeat protein